MPIQQFDIFFSGQILEGQDPAEVRERIRRLFNAQDDQLQRLFSGEAVRIKGGVDEEEASKYRLAFREAGALLEIRVAETAGDSSPTPVAETRTQESDKDTGNLSLLPPNSGSLIDFAPKIEPREIPDISSLTLAPEGSTIDESEEPPAADIDTGNLTVSPAQSGSLEDCQQPVEPYPIPDISNLQIEQPEEEKSQ